MSEKDVSLPANRAFVIQLQASSGASRVGHRGRVEHLASGRAMRFAEEDDLWAFVDSALATECSDQSEPEAQARDWQGSLFSMEKTNAAGAGTDE